MTKKIASRMKRECRKEEDKKKENKEEDKYINYISTQMSILFNLMRAGQYLKSDK